MRYTIIAYSFYSVHFVGVLFDDVFRFYELQFWGCQTTAVEQSAR